MKLKRTMGWALGVVALVSMATYGEFARRTWQRDPAFLLACVEVDTQIAAWTCRQALLHNAWDSEQVESLNRRAGAMFPVSSENPEFAEEMLSLFIARGVDVNAISQDGDLPWTALHGMVLEGNFERVRMLLRHGARADIRSNEGVSALDFSRLMVQKHPGDLKREEIVALLEAQKRPDDAVPNEQNPTP